MFIEICEFYESLFKWMVVESIFVYEDIKFVRFGYEKYVENWIVSMENLVKCGIKIICYNFMLVIDWICIDLNYCLLSGVYVLCFD